MFSAILIVHISHPLTDLHRHRTQKIMKKYLDTVSAEPGSAKPGSAEPGSAEPQLGELSSSNHPIHLSWYSRGYLPHRDDPGLYQFITYRMADSLPASKLKVFEAQARLLPPEKRDIYLRKQIEEWLDAGHGSCVLVQPEIAHCIIDTWKRFANERYDLIAWVVMPNHVHVLIRTYEGASLAKIVQSWKSFTGKRIKAIMDEESDREGTRRAGARRSQVWRSQVWRSQAWRSQSVWMREYWDRYIRDWRHYHKVIDYIHNNPVKAGLVKKPEDWSWSSASEDR